MTDAPVPSPVPAPARPIVLALSGGGFRATLFHLGALRALHEAGRLADVGHVVGVSGGALVAADLRHRFERYLSGIDDGGKELLRLVARGPRGRAMRRLPFWGMLWPGWRLLRWLRGRVPTPKALRSYLMLREYRRLFGRKPLSELGTAEAPDVHLLSTDLASGGLCVFHGDTMTRWLRAAPLADQQLLDQRRANNIMATHAERSWLRSGEASRCRGPASLPLLASSSFPVVLPALAINLRKLDAHGNEIGEPHEVALADGGIIDNSGLTYASFLAGRTDEPRPLVVVSNASASFEHMPARDFRSFVPLSAVATTVSRLVDITAHMRRDAFLMQHFWPQQGVDGIEIVTAHISRWTQEFVLPQASVSDLIRCRTDFDSFSASERAALQQHGYDVMRNALAEAEVAGFPEQRWTHRKLAGAKQRKHCLGRLARSHRVRLRVLALDLPTVFNLVLLSLLVTVVTRFLLRASDNANMELVAADYQQTAFDVSLEKHTKTQRICIYDDPRRKVVRLEGRIAMTGSEETGLWGFGKLVHYVRPADRSSGVPQFAAFVARRPGENAGKGHAMFGAPWSQFPGTRPVMVDVGISATHTSRGVRSVALRAADLEHIEGGGWQGDLYYWERASLVAWSTEQCDFLARWCRPAPETAMWPIYGALCEWSSLLGWRWVKRGFIEISPD